MQNCKEHFRVYFEKILHILSKVEKLIEISYDVISVKS